MDLINKGVQLIRRRSTLRRKHKRNPSAESDTCTADSSPSLCKTPSITSSITSDEGSCYSGNNQFPAFLLGYILTS